MKLKNALIVVPDRDTVRDFKVTGVRRHGVVVGEVWMDKNDNALVTDTMFSETIRTKLHDMIDQEFGPAPEEPITVGQEDFENFVKELGVLSDMDKQFVIASARDQLFDTQAPVEADDTDFQRHFQQLVEFNA